MVSNKISDVGAKLLWDVLMFSKLTYLNLRSNKIGPEGAKALSEILKQNPTLTYLNLHGSKIGDEGVKFIAESLKENTKLLKLILNRNNIGPKGASALAEYLNQNKALNSLGVSGNKVGNEGFTALAKSLTQNSSLTTLLLYDNEIDQNGAISLSEILKHNTTLSVLALIKNNFGDDTLRKIAEEIGCECSSGISILHLSECNITDLTGTENIWKSMPSLKVLNISSNNIKTIPPSFGDLLSSRPNLKAVFDQSVFDDYLFKANLISPPIQVMNKGIDAVISYLQSANETLRTISLFIVGYERAGKSTLRNILLLPEIEESSLNAIYKGKRKETQAIEFFLSKIDQSILHIYDFAGQTEYYSNHELFFKPLSSCYLLVVSLISNEELKEFETIEMEVKFWYSGLKHKLGKILHEPNRIYICFSHHDFPNLNNYQKSLFPVLKDKIHSSLKQNIGLPAHCKFFFLGMNEVEEANLLRTSILESINTINNRTTIYIPPIYQSLIQKITSLYFTNENPVSNITKSALIRKLSSVTYNSKKATLDDITCTLELLDNLGDIEITNFRFQSRDMQNTDLNIDEYNNNDDGDNNANNNNDLNIGENDYNNTDDVVLLFPRIWIVTMFYVADFNALTDCRVSTTLAIPKFNRKSLMENYKPLWEKNITSRGGEKWSEKYLSLLLHIFKEKNICFAVDRSPEEYFYFPTSFSKPGKIVKDYYANMGKWSNPRFVGRRIVKTDDYFQFSFFPTLQVNLCKLVYLLRTTNENQSVSSPSPTINNEFGFNEKWVTLESFSLHHKNSNSEPQNVHLYFNQQNQHLDIYTDCPSNLLEKYLPHECIISSGNFPSEYEKIEDYLRDLEVPLYHKVLSQVYTLVDHYTVNLRVICSPTHFEYPDNDCKECNSVVNHRNHHHREGPIAQRLYGIHFDPNIYYNQVEEIKDLKDDICSLHIKCQSIEEEVSEYRNKIRECKSEYTQLKLARDEEILKLKSVGKEIINELKKKRKEIKTLEAKIEALNTNLEITKTELKTVTNKHTQMIEVVENTKTQLADLIKDIQNDRRLFFHLFDTKEHLNFLKIIRMLDIFRDMILKPFLEWIAPLHFKSLISLSNSNEPNYNVISIIEKTNDVELDWHNKRLVAHIRKYITTQNEDLMNYFQEFNYQKPLTEEELKLVQWNQLLIYYKTPGIYNNRNVPLNSLIGPNTTDISASLTIIKNIFIFCGDNSHNINKHRKIKIVQDCKKIRKTLQNNCKNLLMIRNKTYHSTLKCDDALLSSCYDLVLDTANYFPNCGIHWLNSKFKLSTIAKFKENIDIVMNWKKATLREILGNAPTLQAIQDDLILLKNEISKILELNFSTCDNNDNNENVNA